MTGQNDTPTWSARQTEQDTGAEASGSGGDSAAVALALGGDKLVAFPARPGAGIPPMPAMRVVVSMRATQGW
jgi:hypothetical protein